MQTERLEGINAEACVLLSLTVFQSLSLLFVTLKITLRRRIFCHETVILPFTSTVISSQRAVTVSSFLIFINCFLTATFCKGMFIWRRATQVGEVTRLFI